MNIEKPGGPPDDPDDTLDSDDSRKPKPGGGKDPGDTADSDETVSPGDERTVAANEARTTGPADSKAAAPPPRQDGGPWIGGYRITGKLGEGGMGIVYKAEDTKLERTVAIKFLPRHIATSEDERERFKVEAKAAAGLNHPNIATIYSIEEVEDEMFIRVYFEFHDGFAGFHPWNLGVIGE